MSSSVVLTAALLSAGFLAVVGWFGVADVYHQHFFDTGPEIVAYNAARVAFMAYLTWIVYFAGYAFLAVLKAPLARGSLTPLERAVIGFGTGAGVLHVVLLVLGEAALYYRWLMIGLCLVVLLASAPHLTRLIAAAKARMPLRPSRIAAATGAVIGVAAAWLLVVKGLAPGGGSDYYTHYFYYYLEVLRNHGLQPNDVWYHFYYSKGAGLTFLGMLLTDPQAPELITFTSVIVAGIGLATLCARMLPNSLWPALCTAIYYVSYLVPLNAGDGGEFQKTHEETSALIVLTAWALCMRRIGPVEWRRPCFIMAAATITATAALELPASMIFAAFLGVAALIELVRRARADARAYALLSAFAGGVSVAVLALNYAVTGLATDQGLGVMLRFANIERLYQLGLVPQIIMVAWIRDNYDAAAPPLGWLSVRELRDFMRLDFMWVLIGSGIVALAVHAYRKRFVRRGDGAAAPSPASAASRDVALFTGALIAFLAIISVPAAGAQTISYLRFSWFFLPLLAVFSIACWGVLLPAPGERARSVRTAVLLPCGLFVAVLLSWQLANPWFGRVSGATARATSFAAGNVSLGTAFRVQHSAAAMAQQHVPPGSRIWSTNVDSFCLAPDCIVESVVSFKLSPRLNEVLTGTPEQARSILRAEGLNYFLFSKNANLVDILPYSRLFAPESIGYYFGVTWTNGTDYLLTWRGPGVARIEPDLLVAYAARVAGPENPWFQFRELVPQIKSTMTVLESSPHPWRRLDFAWRPAR